MLPLWLKDCFDCGLWTTSRSERFLNAMHVQFLANFKNSNLLRRSGKNLNATSELLSKQARKKINDGQR